MWNVIDFITNSLYIATVALRVVSYYQVCYESFIAVENFQVYKGICSYFSFYVYVASEYKIQKQKYKTTVLSKELNLKNLLYIG